MGGLALSQAVEDGDEGVVVHGGGLPCKGEAGGVVREFDGVHGVMVEGPMRAQRVSSVTLARMGRLEWDRRHTAASCLSCASLEYLCIDTSLKSLEISLGYISKV